MTVFDAALSYLKLGYSPIPLKSGMKSPVLKWREFQDRRASEQEVTDWFKNKDANIGIVTGKISGLTVVDVDGRPGLDSLKLADISIPKTYTVRSPKGLHFYYQYQESPHTVAGILPNVDIRNDGGMVCAPPSTTPDGEYQVMADHPVAVLGNAFGALNKPVLAPSVRKPDWLVDLISEGAPEGSRNASAFRLSSYFWSKNMPEDVILALLELWNARCTPPLPDRELESIVNSTIRSHPPGRQLAQLKPFTLDVRNNA